MVPISDGVSFDPTSPQEAGPVLAHQVWSSGKHSIGHPQAFFKSWIGKSWHKQTGPTKKYQPHPNVFLLHSLGHNIEQKGLIAIVDDLPTILSEL